MKTYFIEKSDVKDCVAFITHDSNLYGDALRIAAKYKHLKGALEVGMGFVCHKDEIEVAKADLTEAGWQEVNEEKFRQQLKDNNGK